LKVSLHFKDDKGSTRMMLVVGKDGKAVVSLHDPGQGEMGSVRVTLARRPKGWAGLQIWDTEGNTKAALSYSPKYEMTSLIHYKEGSDKEAMAMLATPDHEDSPLFVLRNQAGAVKFVAPKRKQEGGNGFSDNTAAVEGHCKGGAQNHFGGAGSQDSQGVFRVKAEVRGRGPACGPLSLGGGCPSNGQ
jgi:hypothetical protein